MVSTLDDLFCLYVCSCLWLLSPPIYLIWSAVYWTLGLPLAKQAAPGWILSLFSSLSSFGMMWISPSDSIILYSHWQYLSGASLVTYIITLLVSKVICQLPALLIFSKAEAFLVFLQWLKSLNSQTVFLDRGGASACLCSLSCSSPRGLWAPVHWSELSLNVFLPHCSSWLYLV